MKSHHSGTINEVFAADEPSVGLHTFDGSVFCHNHVYGTVLDVLSTLYKVIISHGLNFAVHLDTSAYFERSCNTSFHWKLSKGFADSQRIRHRIFGYPNSALQIIGVKKRMQVLELSFPQDLKHKSVSFVSTDEGFSWRLDKSSKLVGALDDNIVIQRVALQKLKWPTRVFGKITWNWATCFHQLVGIRTVWLFYCSSCKLKELWEFKCQPMFVF